VRERFHRLVPEGARGLHREGQERAEVTAAFELTTGTLVAGRFRLVKQLGEGGMGAVWYAQHTGLGTGCALKFIHQDVAGDAGVRARFEREAKVAASMKSPHVVTMLDYGVWEGVPYIAMEFLEGEDLGQRLGRVGRLSPQETASIVAQVARALTKAHGAGLVHRDLKPENVYVVRDDDHEIVKVLDFGVAKTQVPLAGAGHTRTGAMLGTPCYMSPEQAQGTKAVDHRADLWSLAVIAYRCLVGALPFDSEALGDLLMKIMVHPLPVPSHRAPGLPPAFDAWWARGAARDPAQRFQSAKELSEALGQALGVTAPPLGRTPAPVDEVAGTEPTYLAGGSHPGPMVTPPGLGGSAPALTPHPATVAHPTPVGSPALEPTIQSEPGRMQYPGVLPPVPQHATHAMSPAARTFDGRAPRGWGGAMAAAVAVGAAVLGLAAFLLLRRGDDPGPGDAAAVEAAPQATAPPSASPTASAPEPAVVAEEPAPEPAPTAAKTAAASPPRPAAAPPPPRTGKVVVAPPAAPPRTGKVVIAPPK
jgi:hypothetical protein